MFGLSIHNLANYRVLHSLNFIITTRHKHSNITFNTLTKSLLIDNSLIKDLELVQKRRNKNKKFNTEIQEHSENSNKTISSIEMSESHESQPYIKFIGYKK